MCEVAETEKYRDTRDTCHVTMTSLNDVIESLDYVINIDSSPFTLSLSTGNVTHSDADLGMFSMFGRTGAPTKRGPHKSSLLQKDWPQTARQLLLQ